MCEMGKVMMVLIVVDGGFHYRMGWFACSDGIRRRADMDLSSIALYIQRF